MFKKLSSLLNGKDESHPLVSDDLVSQAKNIPGGWIYKIEGSYAEYEFTPPGAIVGAWQVDNNGKIIKESYKENPNYRPDLKGKKFENKEQYEQWCQENT